MPPLDHVRRDQRRHLSQGLSSDRWPFGGESTAPCDRFGKGRPVVVSPQQVSDRAWAIIGAGISALSVGVSLFAPVNKWIGIGGIVAGVLITAYGVFHDRQYANKLSLVFTQDPPYTFRDTRPGYRAEFRVGVRGSRRIPPDVKVSVTNIQPTPSSHPHFRADYPYSLPQRGQNSDRELLFQLGTAWNNTEGSPIFSGIQMDTRGEPDTFAMDRHEIWDVALKVVAADAKSLDAWFSVAPDATGKVRVSRHDWKPITL